MKLNLGCGQDIRPSSDGWVNIDWRQHDGVDMVLDITKVPLPFPNGSVEYVLTSHVFEHLPQWENVLIDIHRMLKPGGMCEVRVPRGFNAAPFHVRYFDEHTMDLFVDTGHVREPGGGLDPVVIFDLVSFSFGRRNPFKWHMKHYLNIDVSYDCRFGTRCECIWILRKKGDGKASSQG